jgi:hypothetical protein
MARDGAVLDCMAFGILELSSLLALEPWHMHALLCPSIYVARNYAYWLHCPVIILTTNCRPSNVATPPGRHMHEYVLTRVEDHQERRLCLATKRNDLFTQFGTEISSAINFLRCAHVRQSLNTGVRPLSGLWPSVLNLTHACRSRSRAPPPIFVRPSSSARFTALSIIVIIFAAAHLMALSVLSFQSGYR